MIFLSSSSFFLSDYLTKQLGKNNYRSGQLSYGLKHDHIAALTIKEKSAGFDSRNWLALNQRRLGVLHAQEVGRFTNREDVEANYRNYLIGYSFKQLPYLGKPSWVLVTGCS